MKHTLSTPYDFQKYIPSIGLYTTQPEQLAFTGPNDKLSAIKADELLNIPEETIVDLADGSQVRMYEVAPSGDYDTSRIIVRVMDFANGIAPHSYGAALAVAELLGHKVVVVPWNDISLSRKERQDLRFGNFDSISRKQAEGLEKITSETQDITLYGYSLGAQAALPLSKAINENGVKQNDRIAIAEPPNTVKRSKYTLLRDFSNADNGDWAEATRDSGWDALIDVMGVRSSDESDYMKHDNALFARNAVRLTNIAMIGAMQQDTFADDLGKAGLYLPTDGARVVMARERFSAMVPKRGLEDAYDYVESSYQRLGKDILALLISPTTREYSVGHAVGNNPFVAASLIERTGR